MQHNYQTLLSAGAQRPVILDDEEVEVFGGCEESCSESCGESCGTTCQHTCDSTNSSSQWLKATNPS